MFLMFFFTSTLSIAGVEGVFPPELGGIISLTSMYIMILCIIIRAVEILIDSDGIYSVLPHNQLTGELSVLANLVNLTVL